VSRSKQAGFTIVELLIVIVVIGILAAITIVAYNGVTSRAQDTALKTDVANASRQMQLAYVDAGAYSTTFPSTVKISNGTILSLSQLSGGYCINAESTTNVAARWSYSSANGLQIGLCSGAVIAGSELGINPNLITNTDFTSGWGLNFQNGVGRSLTTRTGDTNDPYPGRPVLVLNNTSTASTTWAVLQAASINQAAIISGHTYVRSFWVRRVGSGWTSGIAPFAIQNPQGINTTISLSSVYTPAGDTWQKMTQNGIATQAGQSDNVVYQALNTPNFTVTGWTLEFQGFGLREQ
jgi:prepilin-type N-terminal cleavage/methylation domain-containing protein